MEWPILRDSLQSTTGVVGRGRSVEYISSPRGSGVEHFLGKEGVTGSNPVVGSRKLAARILHTLRQPSRRGV